MDKYKWKSDVDSQATTEFFLSWTEGSNVKRRVAISVKESNEWGIGHHTVEQIEQMMSALKELVDEIRKRQVG